MLCAWVAGIAGSVLFFVACWAMLGYFVFRPDKAPGAGLRSKQTDVR
jgi:hypothetical protein